MIPSRQCSRKCECRFHAQPCNCSHCSEYFPYEYRWNRQGRKGEPCRVLVRGKMNSCSVEFLDGFKMVTSRNALRKRKPTELWMDERVSRWKQILQSQMEAARLTQGLGAGTQSEANELSSGEKAQTQTRTPGK